jgi:Anti-sigma-K factor rskA, C-terminal
VESFQTAPVIRYYGSEAEDAEIEAAGAGETRPSADGPELRLVLPQPSRGPGVIATLAAVAGLAAVGLATWAFVSVVRAVDEEGPAPPPPRRAAPAPRPKPQPGRAVSLLALPSTERYRVAGSVGRITLAVTPGDRGYLVLNGLGLPPAGRVYYAWVIPPAGRSVRSAARFRGKAAVVPLRGRVPEGAAVAITLERASGTSGLTKTPRLVAIRRSS